MPTSICAAGIDDFTLSSVININTDYADLPYSLTNGARQDIEWVVDQLETDIIYHQHWRHQSKAIDLYEWRLHILVSRLIQFRRYR